MTTYRYGDYGVAPGSGTVSGKWLKRAVWSWVLMVVVCLLLMAVMTDSLLAQESPCNDLADRSCEVIIDSVKYEVAFIPGPFGPGLSGTAILSVDTVKFDEYPFTVNGRLVSIEGLANFYCTGFSIVLIHGELVELDFLPVEGGQ